MQIAEILGQKDIGVIALTPDTLIPDAALLLSDQVIGVAVVIDSDKGMQGILSERDISRGLAEYGANLVEMCAEELMTRDVVSCDPDCDVADAVTMMQERNIRHLPVIEDGNHLVGMISIRDLMEAQAEELREAS